MERTTALKIQTARLSKFAAAVILCWGLGASTYVAAINALHTGHSARADKAKPTAALHLPQNVEILSPKDADLYRAIFAAQTKGNWAEADRIAAELSDRRL